MIDRYSLKTENGEEVLYLFLDFNFEIASQSNNKLLPLNFKDRVLEYINNIKFHGNRVILVVGGIIVCSMLITGSDIKKVDNSFKGNYVNDSIVTSDNLILESVEVVGEQEEVQEEKINTIINTKREETAQGSNNQLDNNVNSATDSKDYIQGDNSKKTELEQKKKSDVNVSDDKGTDNTRVIETEKEVEEVQEQKEMVTFSNNGSIVTMEFEEYIVGVVAAEMPASFNVEALKAQALVARTYALNRISLGKGLTSDSSTQNYKDLNWMKSYWGSNFNTYYNKIKKAVYDTSSKYITYNGKYIDAVYFSTSNGYTESAIDVWGYDIPYLKSVESLFDKDTTPYLREVLLEITEVDKILGFEINMDSVVEIKRNSSERVLEITIDGHSYKGLEFQKMFSLRSNDYDINISDNNIIFTTRGYGHGVGMSQYGANMLALRGYNYVDIIKYYYLGVSVV